MNTRKLSAFAGKYKYVLIILLAGLILLLLPGGSRTKAEPTAAQPMDTQMQTIQTEEQRLAQLLRQISGAGQVQVLLSYRCSAERPSFPPEAEHRRRWSCARSAHNISARSSSATERTRRRCSLP